MTFTQSVKNEILRSVRSVKGCCAEAFLTAVLKATGSLELSLGNMSYVVDSENKDFLHFCGELSAAYIGSAYTIGKSSVSAKGADIYTAHFDGKLGESLGFVKNGELNFYGECSVPENACCHRAFLQALFVACGSVEVPLADDDLGESKSNYYHLEIRLSDSDFAKSVCDGYSELPFKVLERKNHYVLYLKGNEQIADFLVCVNAMSAKLKLENIIIGRSIRNTANRQRNCISANIDKAIVASGKQIEAIEKLQANGKFDSLAENLKEIALLRLDNPEATLDELAEKLGISKSGARHRLNKILELAED